MKIIWEPSNTSLKERFNVFLVGLFSIWVFWGETLSTFLVLTIYFYGSIYSKTILLIYLIYAFGYNKDAKCTGGWRNGSEWFKNWKLWQIFREYFPCDLIKTVDLPSDRNYIFAAFPHGVISLGTFASFGNNASPFKKLFPGIRAKIATLDFHFNIPIFREVLMAWGMISVTKESLKYCLTTSNDKDDPYNNDKFTSNAVVLMVGGAQEALNSRPNNYVFVLNKRKGFIKLAYETGCPIVPVITFGEVDIYDQVDNPPGSCVRKFQEYIKTKTGISPVIYLGRGFLQYNYGIIPNKRSMTTVVGAPIEVPKKDNPSIEEIDDLHKIFCNELKKLFDTHKRNYVKNYENIQLKIE